MEYKNNKEKILDLTPKHLPVSSMQGNEGNYLNWRKVNGEWFPYGAMEKLFELEEFVEDVITVSIDGKIYVPVPKEDFATWEESNWQVVD